MILKRRVATSKYLFWVLGRGSIAVIENKTVKHPYIKLLQWIITLIINEK